MSVWVLPLLWQLEGNWPALTDCYPSVDQCTKAVCVCGRGGGASESSGI